MYQLLIEFLKFVPPCIRKKKGTFRVPNPDPDTQKIYMYILLYFQIKLWPREAFPSPVSSSNNFPPTFA